MVRRSNKTLTLRKLKPFIKGVIAGTAALFLLSLLFSFVFCLFDAPDGSAAVFGYASLGGGCVVCGIFVGGGKGRSGFFWGAVGGVIMFLLCGAVSAVTGSLSGSEIFGKLLCCVICGLAGGIAGVNITANRL